MGSAHYNPFAMPELPDLSVVSDALHASLAGRMIESAEAPGPLAVRGTPAELDAMIGQRVQSITRRGKFLLIKLDRDAVACNPMLTGRFQLAEPGIKLPAQTAFILRLGTRAQAPGNTAGWFSIISAREATVPIPPVSPMILIKSLSASDIYFAGCSIAVSSVPSVKYGGGVVNPFVGTIEVIFRVSPLFKFGRI